MLTPDQFERLNELIEAVSEDSEFINNALNSTQSGHNLPFVLADVATSCVLLVAHVEDITVDLINVAGRTFTAEEAEISRRLEFMRAASLQTLLDVRRRAIEIRDRGQ